MLICSQVIKPVNMADKECESVPSSCENSRKRKRNEENWKKKKAKVRRNLGLQYVSSKTNKIVPAKQKGEGCNCVTKSENSNMKWCAYHMLTCDEKDSLFSEFYNIGDYNLQNSYIFSHIIRRECDRIYEGKRNVSEVSRRKYSFTYYVKNSEGMSIRVCAKAFCDIFGISKRRLSTARGDRKAVVDKNTDIDHDEGSDDKNESDNNEPNVKQIIKYSPHLDRRGHHGKQKAVYSELEKGVIEHIRKFPLYRSHYTRKKSTRKYIRSVKSVAEMYRLYKMQNDEDCL